MKLIHVIAAAVLLVVAGCGDPIDPPPDRFWSDRGGVFYTEGLAFESPGRVATVDVDGGMGASLFTGAIPCPPRRGKIVFADVSIDKADWAIYLADADGAGAPARIVYGVGIEKPIFGIVDLSPSASRVLYVLVDPTPPSRSTLYMVNVDGTGQTRLSDKVVSSSAAAFSPDGGRAAFYAGAGKNELTVVDLATGISTVAATNAHPWTIENLDWSPDGRVAYVGDDKRDSMRQIFVVDTNGGAPVQLTYDTSEGNRWPAWSPDGSKIAYIHGKELWIMNADGSGKRQITTESEWPYQIKMFPQWSADQSMILFTAVAGNGVQGLLQVVDLSTGRVNALATGAARGFWR